VGIRAGRVLLLGPGTYHLIRADEIPLSLLGVLFLPLEDFLAEFELLGGGCQSVH